ncbi:MAG: peptidoglycan-binding protein [Polyangiaceae bacterium]|nr:peptidoglycan-binding protein [Polyangiaceae bacterium]
MAGNRYAGIAALAALFVVLGAPTHVGATTYGEGTYGGDVYSGSGSSSTVPVAGGGVCINCGNGSSGGGSSPVASTTAPKGPATGDTPTGATATSTTGRASTSTPFRCAETAPAADGLSGAGLVNLLVSLGIVPSTKAKIACDALTSAKAAPSAPALSSGSFRFSTPLSKGMRSAEVRQLQQFLNTRGFVLASGTELGAPGYETDLFGLLTEDAVKRFQAAYAAEILAPVGLTAPSGFFGPSTIRKANGLVGA